MRIAITGEKGFIATNLQTEIQKRGHEFVSLTDSELLPYKNKKGEPCVYRNHKDLWTKAFVENKIDVVVHNAAVVGTDVVALNAKKSISTNILGTQTITDAANEANILNVYLGTTVIYNTPKYQETSIKEDSEKLPLTHYAIQKYAGEMIVKNSSKNWLVLRPLFAYGGVGDPNSLIAKTIYSAKNKLKNVDMFLDPEKCKDYMHVFTFCDAIVSAIESEIRNDDFNVSIETPHKTKDIIDFIQQETGLNIEGVLKWHPETDYLGNHLLSCQKFKDLIGFKRNPIDIKTGISMAARNIMFDTSDYDPLVYIKEAKEKNVNLLDFYPKS